MSDWKSWDLQRWSERLLNHFFRRREHHPSAVVVLLVTAEELARTSADASAKVEDVREAFLDAVRTGIRRSKSLLEDASDYEGWPGPPRLESPPRFVAHLLFTCIAASESSDELGDERSFVSRLRELTRDQLPDHSLQILPRLWEHLAAWLAMNERVYRGLHLPDPGGLTRIGYTVKLAFPDRRDQRQLSDLLDRAGLAGHEPPVGRVLSLVSKERSRFRRSFLIALDDFRRAFEVSAAASRLVEHRFWAAVREAALRGRGRAEFDGLDVRVSLLCEEQDERLSAFVVTDERAEGIDLGFAKLPIAYGDWRYAFVRDGDEHLEAEQLEQISRDVLAGSIRLPRVSSHVEQGLIPLAVGSHGLLELAAHDQLSEVTVALVHEEQLTHFMSLFGQGASTRRSSYENWVQVHSPSLRSLPSNVLENTSLNRTWFLHESLLPTTIRVRGGVRADDGWLGTREVLPHITAPGASRLRLEAPASAEDLIRSENGKWLLPRRDLAGEYTLVASLGESGEARQTIRFHGAPVSEAFKAPTEPEAWIAEGTSGTVTLTSSVPFADHRNDDDCAAYCERLALLGVDVGEFVAHPHEAAWRIVHFGGRLIGARGHYDQGDSVPTKQVSSPNARRRWRRLLFESRPSGSDTEFETARKQVKARVSSHATLPKIDTSQVVPDVTPLRAAAPIDAVDRLVRIVCGRASTRAGIDWRDWKELALRVLNIDEHQLGHVTRAWMEAGLIDCASYARWWHRAVFARSPRLVGYIVGDRVGATLSGLVLSSTMDEVQWIASRTGALTEERFSVSQLVPRSLTFRLPNTRSLEELGRACRIDVSWIDLASLSSVPRHDGTSAPPEHYERASHWLRWSLLDDEHKDVVVQHWMRPDRPDFWLVCRDDKRVWSYDLNLARGWAARLLDAPIVSVVDESYVAAIHAYLPLPMARAMSIIGQGLSGPTERGRYLYPVASPQLRELVFDSVSRTFDPSRLPVGAANQTLG